MPLPEEIAVAPQQASWVHGRPRELGHPQRSGRDVKNLQQQEEGVDDGKAMPWSNLPKTSPTLHAENQRSSLVNPTAEAKQEVMEACSEPELMVGEIRSFKFTDDIVLAKKACVVICVSFVAAVLISMLAGPLDYQVNTLEVVGFVSTVLLSYPVIRLVVRFFAFIITARASALLYQNNSFYFAVALHRDISTTIWSVVALYVWNQLYPEWVYRVDREALPRNAYTFGGKLIECFLIYRLGVLLKRFVVVVVAMTYLRRPYLQRVQSSILAQCILLLLTDYATKGNFDPADQRFAMDIGRQGFKKGKNISFYAASKAMGYIARNKLRHPFFRELNESDTLHSSEDARTLGRFLFDQLIHMSRPSPPSEPTPAPFPAPTTGRVDGYFTKGANTLGMGGSGSDNSITGGLYTRPLRSGNQSSLARPKASPSFLGNASLSERLSSLGHRTGFGSGAGTGPGPRSGTGDRDRDLTRTARGDGEVREDVSALLRGGIGQQLSVIQNDESQAGSAANSVTRATGRISCCGSEDSKERPPVAGSGSIKGEVGESRSATAEGPIPRGGDPAEFSERLAEFTAESRKIFSTEVDGVGGRGDDHVTANAAAHPSSRRKQRRQRGSRSSTDNDGENARDDDDGNGGEGEEDVTLSKDNLCPGMEDALLNLAFKIFDGNGNDSVTREEMVLGVVNTFKDHRSLAHTLQASEHIAGKLGYIVMCPICLILLVMWLSIWGADTVSLSVNVASFLIAFSFMVGTAANDLTTAVLFIFVSRPYDVGDRILIYDGSYVDAEPMDVTVAKVYLRTTVFRRCDKQILHMPNHLLASKAIVNIQRAANHWRELVMPIEATTSSREPKKLREVLKRFEFASKRARKTRIPWGEDEDEAFRMLRESLSSPLVLAFPDMNSTFELHTDASSVGAGATLMQAVGCECDCIDVSGDNDCGYNGFACQDPESACLGEYDESEREKEIGGIIAIILGIPSIIGACSCAKKKYDKTKKAEEEQEEAKEQEEQ
eukprot:g5628.t1